MSKIKAVLFDYDGTLMDTNNIILESWQHTFRAIKGQEHPEKELYATFGEPLSYTMERFFPGEDVDRCVEIYRNYQLDHYQKLIEMFPGMVELVKDLKDRGYLTGVVTSRLPSTTFQGLDKYGLTPYFDAVVTCADTDKHKPDPEPALLCLEKLGVQPSEAVMIGDTTYDILCGKRAGVKSGLVGWSVAYTEELLQGETKPDFIMNTAEELYRELEAG